MAQPETARNRVTAFSGILRNDITAKIGSCQARELRASLVYSSYGKDQKFYHGQNKTDIDKEEANRIR